MADYVRKTILSQSYAHIDVVELTPDQKQQYEFSIRAYQAPRAKLFFGVEIEPEVKTKDGSLTVYATVYGSLSAVIKSFGPDRPLGTWRATDVEEALKRMHASSRMLAEACILESLFLSKQGKNALLRGEARTGVVKTSRDLFTLGNTFSSEVNELRARALMQRLGEIYDKATFLGEQLSETADRELVFKPFSLRVKGFPKSPLFINGLKEQKQLSDYQRSLGDLLKLTTTLAGGR